MCVAVFPSTLFWSYVPFANFDGAILISGDQFQRAVFSTWGPAHMSGIANTPSQSRYENLLVQLTTGERGGQSHRAPKTERQATRDGNSIQKEECGRNKRRTCEGYEMNTNPVDLTVFFLSVLHFSRVGTQRKWDQACLLAKPRPIFIRRCDRHTAEAETFLKFVLSSIVCHPNNLFGGIFSPPSLSSRHFSVFPCFGYGIYHII